MASIQESGRTLHAAQQALRSAWENTQHEWGDQVRADFERHFMELLFPSVARAEKSIEPLAEAVAKARQMLD